MNWKIWDRKNKGSKPSSTKGEDQNSPENGEGNGTPPKENKLTHKFLDAQIRDLIETTTNAVTPMIEEIQILSGHRQETKDWLKDKQNMVDFLLGHIEKGTTPSRKNILYGDVLSPNDSRNMAEGVEYLQRLNTHVDDKRPADGFFKNMKQQSLTDKQKFIQEFEIFTIALMKDVETERDQQEEALDTSKQECYDAIDRLYSFYKQIERALDNGDFESMLDISHGRANDALARILDLDLSDIYEHEEIKQLVEHIGVYDKIVLHAAEITDAEAGMHIISQVTKDIKDDFEIIRFMQDTIDCTNDAAVKQRYCDFLEDFLGEYIPVGQEDYLRRSCLISAKIEEDTETLVVFSKGGTKGAEREEFKLPNAQVAKALFTHIQKQDHFTTIYGGNCALNTNYISAAEDTTQKLMNAAPQEDANDTDQDAPIGFIDLRLAVDERGLTAIDTSEITSDQADTIMQKLRASQDYTAIGENLLINTDDVMAIKYSSETSTLYWSIPYANNTADWMSESISATEAEYFINIVKDKAEFVQTPDGWLLNTDMLQSAEYGFLPEDLDEEDALSIDQHLIDQIAPDAEATFTPIDLNSAFGDFEEEEQEESSPADLEEKEPSKYLRLSTKYGPENGFSHYYIADVEQDIAAAFLQEISAKSAMIEVQPNVVINTDLLNYAHIKHMDVEEHDENTDITQTKQIPVITVSPYGYHGAIEEDTTYPISEDRFSTIIEDMAKGETAHAFRSENDDANKLVVYNTHMHLTTALSSAKDKGASDVDFQFKGYGRDEGIEQATASNLSADQQIAFTNSLKDQGFIVAEDRCLIDTQNLTRIKFNPESSDLSLYSHNGLAGNQITVREYFSRQNLQLLKTRLEACGFTDTELTAPEQTAQKILEAQTVKDLNHGKHDDAQMSKMLKDITDRRAKRSMGFL